MDDTTRLASELIGKLKELNHKVCDYRQGLAQEFRRHSRDLLHDVPEHVSARVEEVIAEELHNYPALGPEFALDTPTADPGCAANRWSPSERVSPSPDLPHTAAVSSSPPDRGRDRDRDRDRDREFHGLFMPSYLPLLEVMQPDTAVSSSIADSPTDASQDTESNGAQEASPIAELDNTPPQLDTITDLASPVRTTPEDSPLRRRRSALRRSSSGSTRDIQSPRRVRFDVAGEEVLPTASPPTPIQSHPLPVSPPPEFENMPIHPSINHIIFEGETSILGDSPPPPKKISSTERLRALARSSTEDVSKWTVVGNLQDDDDDDDEGLVMFRPKNKSKAPVPELAIPTLLKSGIASQSIPDGQSGVQATGIADGRPFGQSKAVDDLLGMPPLGSFREQKLVIPRQSTYNVEPKLASKLSPAPSGIARSFDSATVSQPHETAGADEDMFGFSDEEGDLPPRTRKTHKYIDDEVEEEEQMEPSAANSAEGSPRVASTPPGITIAKPAILSPVSPAPSYSRQSGASGSYRGKPFVIGVIRDEEIYRKAAEMGDVGMFVGSVDGRTGVDPSDLYGSPRSLGKRLLEEAHLRRRNADRPEK